MQKRHKRVKKETKAFLEDLKLVNKLKSSLTETDTIQLGGVLQKQKEIRACANCGGTDLTFPPTNVNALVGAGALPGAVSTQRRPMTVPSRLTTSTGARPVRTMIPSRSAASISSTWAGIARRPRR